MVRDLLQAFVCHDWVARVDFATLERCSDTYVSDDLRARADDIVWRIRCGETYVYLLIEFQSSNDPFMPVRVLTYEGLLYQDLIRTKKLKSGSTLPAVLAIVIYNGKGQWSAPDELASLVRDAPPELRHYCPQSRYLLIDESHCGDHVRALKNNAVVALFRIESSRRIDQMAPIVAELLEGLISDGQQSLCSAVRVWVQKVIFPRLTKGGSMSMHEWPEVTQLTALIAEFEADNLRRGREQGTAAMLMRQLERRFGVLPASVRERLEAAPLAQLEEWVDRIFAARSLDELLDSRPTA